METLKEINCPGKFILYVLDIISYPVTIDSFLYNYQHNNFYSSYFYIRSFFVIVNSLFDLFCFIVLYYFLSLCNVRGDTLFIKMINIGSFWISVSVKELFLLNFMVFHDKWPIWFLPVRLKRRIMSKTLFPCLWFFIFIISSYSRIFTLFIIIIG